MKTIVRKILIHTLQTESRLVLWKYKPRIIVITGSVGKTSTKDAIFAVLSKISYVRKSEKSYNSEIGLPLTILGVSNGWNNPWTWFKNICKGLWLFIVPHKYPKWLVLEVGVGKPGDMKRTASWLSTDAVVITAIGEMPAHIEFFNSRKHLIEEKSGLIKTLKKDGLLILNNDDETVIEMGAKTKNRTVTYGFKEKSTVLASSEAIAYSVVGEPEGVIFRVDIEGSSFPVVIEGVFGKNHIFASLATLALSVGLKLNIVEAINALKNYDVPSGRMRLLKGINESLIIDDTYNSSPFACESALKTLGQVKSPKDTARKIAILGDMLELGKHTVEAHKNIGKVAKENADVVIVVGQRAEAIKEGALEVGMNSEQIFNFLDSYKAGEFVKTFIKSGDVILVKGSQGMRMERVVGEILLDQENKTKLLVRQDKEWLEKK
jgi:UDP-N-acetylmuramoyl-tripeptide--D-alanyl-D-alanine ligase